MNLVASYSDAGQLVPALGEIREGLRQKGKERRYLQAFRQTHFEFLQRYNAAPAHPRDLEQARRDR